MLKRALAFLLLSLIAMMPIESAPLCPNGKCPGSIYERLGIPDPYLRKPACDKEHCGPYSIVHPLSPLYLSHVKAFCNPNGPCHLRDLERQGLKKIDKCGCGVGGGLIMGGLITGLILNDMARPHCYPCYPPMCPPYPYYPCDNCIWYKGKHLYDPSCPNRCAPLKTQASTMSNINQISGEYAKALLRNQKTKDSPIYKRAHNQEYITPLTIEIIPSLSYEVEITPDELAVVKEFYPAYAKTDDGIRTIVKLKHRLGHWPHGIDFCYSQPCWLYPTPNDADRGRKPRGAGTQICGHHGHGHCDRGHHRHHDGWGLRGYPYFPTCPYPVWVW